MASVVLYRHWPFVGFATLPFSARASSCSDRECSQVESAPRLGLIQAITRMSAALPFTVIEVHTSPWEAHVSRALLESEGIPAFLAGEHHVGANWPMSLMLGGVKLLVPVEHLASAQRVLAMRDSGALHAALAGEFPQSPVACSHCGAATLVECRNWSSVALSVALLFLCEAIFPPTKGRKCASCGAWA